MTVADKYDDRWQFTLNISAMIRWIAYLANMFLFIIKKIIIAHAQGFFASPWATTLLISHSKQ